MIISLFYPLRGGAEQQALLLAKSLIKQGGQVTVLTRCLAGHPAYEVLQGVPVYRAIYAVPRWRLFGITYFLSVCWFLFRRRKSYDIIHCHILHGLHSLAACMLKRLLGKKVVIKLASSGLLSDFVLLREGLWRTFYVKQARKADRIVSICALSKQEAITAGFDPAAVILLPNGVDAGCFRPQAEAQSAEVSLLFIGRLDDMKGVDVLLKAFQAVCSALPQTSLVIVGDGPSRPDLENLARSLNLGEAVCFKGVLEDVRPSFSRATVMVMPSRSEGLSNVVLEAMASGLPVVASRVGGNPDMITDRVNGLLVEPDNVEQLSGALMTILTAPELAASYGREARKTIEQHYSIDAVTSAYIQLYAELL